MHESKWSIYVKKKKSIKQNKFLLIWYAKVCYLCLKPWPSTFQGAVTFLKKIRLICTKFFLQTIWFSFYFKKKMEKNITKSNFTYATWVLDILKDIKLIFLQTHFQTLLIKHNTFAHQNPSLSVTLDAFGVESIVTNTHPGPKTIHNNQHKFFCSIFSSPCIPRNFLWGRQFLYYS